MNAGDPDPKAIQPCCFVVASELMRLGAKGVTEGISYPFQDIGAIVHAGARVCVLEKITSPRPDQEFLLSINVKLKGEECERYQSNWLRVVLTPDKYSTFWMFGIGASFLRPGERVIGIETKLMFKFAERGAAFAEGTQKYHQARRFNSGLRKLSIAPPVDQLNKAELEGLWGTYITALEELARRKTLFFHVTRISDETMWLNHVVREISYSLDDFYRDNVELNRTMLTKEHFQLEQKRELPGAIWEVVGRESFSIIDSSMKLALEAEIRGDDKGDAGARQDTQGAKYATLLNCDPFRGVLVFSTGDDGCDPEGNPIPLPNEGDYLVPIRAGELAQIRRMRVAYDTLKSGKLFNQALASCLYDASLARPPQNGSNSATKDEDIGNSLLQRSINEEQLSAVKKAILAPDLALIQGPPGTGKTTVIAEIIHQIIRIRPHAKILLSSQSHLAVDNALEKLKGDPNLRPLRIATSSEARLSLESEGEQFLESRLDRWVEEGSGIGTWSYRDNIVARLFSERLKSLSLDGPHADLLKTYRDEAIRELPRADRQILKDNYLATVNVIAATCSECGRNDFRKKWVGERGFDYVIVDEVSKASPPELFVPLVLGQRVILIGDHRQLPPMIDEDLIEQRLIEAGASEVEKKLEEMKESLFERLFRTADDAIKETLRTQYRMHESIQDAIEQFYTADGGLRLGLDPEEMDDPDLSLAGSRYHGFDAGNFIAPYDHAIWIDVEGVECKEGTSFYNEEEIEAAAGVIRLLRSCKGWDSYTKALPDNDEIGVISFYGAQTARLRERLTEDSSLLGSRFRIRPVDKFQGMERDVVIVSLVRASRRSDERGSQRRGYGIGFARDYRRINVAFSRARRLLVIIGDRQHFCHEGGDEASTYYRRIWDTIDAKGAGRKSSQLFAALERGGLS